jgi:hypothetical protein
MDRQPARLARGLLDQPARLRDGLKGSLPIGGQAAAVRQDDERLSLSLIPSRLREPQQAGELPGHLRCCGTPVGVGGRDRPRGLQHDVEKLDRAERRRVLDAAHLLLGALLSHLEPPRPRLQHLLPILLLFGEQADEKRAALGYADFPRAPQVRQCGAAEPKALPAAHHVRDRHRLGLRCPAVRPGQELLKGRGGQVPVHSVSSAEDL